jgi:hypothetical protein
MNFKLNILLFGVFIIVGYILIPKQVFTAGYWWLAIPFILMFSILSVCSIKNIVSNSKYKGSKKGIIASIFGLGALQVCGLSAFACSSALGFTLMATILPHTTLSFFQNYSLQIIIFSLIIQIYAIYQLKCLNFLKKL